MPHFFGRVTAVSEYAKGDMSIIDPRPPLPREVILYTPEQMDRLLVKGGLSCIARLKVAAIWSSISGSRVM